MTWIISKWWDYDLFGMRGAVASASRFENSSAIYLGLSIRAWSCRTSQPKLPIFEAFCHTVDYAEDKWQSDELHVTTTLYNVSLLQIRLPTASIYFNNKGGITKCFYHTCTAHWLVHITTPRGSGWLPRGCPEDSNQIRDPCRGL